MKQAMWTLRFAAVARVHAVERDGPVEHQLVVRVDLAKRVIDVRQLIGGDVGERIALGGPVSVIADDLVGGWAWGRARLQGNIEQSEEDRDHGGHLSIDPVAQGSSPATGSSPQGPRYILSN